MNYEPRNRIDGGTRMFMLMAATAIWLFSLIPIVNVITNTAGWLIFWLWFSMRGASLNRKMAVNVGSFLIGYLPVIGTIASAFPFVINANIKAIQAEDAAENAAMEAKMEDERQAAYEYQQMLYEEELAAEEAAEAEAQAAAAAALAVQTAARSADEGGVRDINNPDFIKPAPTYDDEALGEDALDILNKKVDRTPAEAATLNQATRILQTGQISPADRNNPALLAAWNKYQTGKRLYNPNIGSGYRINGQAPLENRNKRAA